jgi:hypothetical protein
LFTALLCVGVLSAQASSATPKKVKLDAAQKKQFEALISSAANVDMKIFDGKKITDAERIEFGIQYNIDHNSKAFKLIRNWGSGEMFTLAPKYVDVASLKFFGAKVSKHRSAGQWIFKHGVYIVSLNETEGELKCKITSVQTVNDSTIKIGFTIHNLMSDQTEGRKSATFIRTKNGNWILKTS